MAKFRVLNPSHTQPSDDPKKPLHFKCGDIVDSDIDLCERFPNCFTKVGKFVEDSDDESPPQKTVAVSTSSPKTAPSQDDSGESQEEEVIGNQVRDLKDQIKDLGSDVTSAFPLAKEAKVSIFKKGSEFYAYAPNSTTPLNKGQGFANKGKVNSWLASQV